MDPQGHTPYILSMSIQNIWNNLAAGIGAIPRNDLLIIALAALIAGWLGSMMIRRGAPLGRLIRSGSTLVLAGVLVTVVLQLSRFDPRFDIAVPQLGLPEQVVEGWRYFGYAPAEDETDADMGRRHAQVARRARRPAPTWSRARGVAWARCCARLSQRVARDATQRVLLRTQRVAARDRAWGRGAQR